MSSSTDLVRDVIATLNAAEENEGPLGLVEALAEARDLLEEAHAEAMAEAVVAGNSVREVARAAGLAPNSVNPRLARTGLLSGYAESGRVGADQITLAKRDLSRGDLPEGEGTMRFVPRRRT